ncbi:hypothetical protein LR48_Vigan02g071200 [Vigna angularis]|uniref:Putative plant transposon protein domain-containing protein n=1 Tax=Phaseolus angularis TaxID=3914 RepID=A0A0L9TVY6_PHAAN|nr:hypothetical protein LR48_Vigan02g071200 [Vigna angularis]
MASVCRASFIRDVAGKCRKLEEKIMKQKSDSRLSLSKGGDPSPPPSPPSRHKKWKLACLRSSSSYTCNTAREIFERIYERAMAERVDYEDMKRTLCVPGGHFERSRSDVPSHIKRASLIPLAKYWMTFYQANIHPCSHMSDITTQRAILLNCILSGNEVNLGAVIAEEIKSCARAATTRLQQQAPRVRRRAPPPAQGPAHEAAPFQMRDMYMSLMEARMIALYRGEKELLRMLTSAFPDREFISQEEFAARVAYPEDLAHADVGAVGGDATDEEEDSND